MGEPPLRRAQSNLQIPKHLTKQSWQWEGTGKRGGGDREGGDGRANGKEPLRYTFDGTHHGMM